MAQKKGGLGRGFAALFEDNAAEELAGQQISALPIGEIEPNRAQPRKSFDEEAIGDLAESIREHGVLQPILVRPSSDGSYQIVAGERRYRAARAAGLSEVPVIVKALSDEDAALIALIENLQREDLTALEEAAGIRRLMDEFSLSQEQAAARLGKSRPAVANALRLLALPEDVRAMLENGSLSAGHARALLALEDDALITETAKVVTEKALSVRQTEALVKKLKAAPKSRKPKEKKRDTFFVEAELSLGAALGRTVEIHEGKKGGQLVIEYFDREDLTKIAQMLEN